MRFELLLFYIDGNAIENSNRKQKKQISMNCFVGDFAMFYLSKQIDE